MQDPIIAYGLVLRSSGDGGASPRLA